MLVNRHIPLKTAKSILEAHSETFGAFSAEHPGAIRDASTGSWVDALVLYEWLGYSPEDEGDWIEVVD